MAVMTQVMIRLLYPVLLSLVLVAPSNAQSGYWRNRDGKPVAETESRKSKADFAGSLIATTDEDWEKKWNTPPETTPRACHELKIAEPA